jgi:hypothetical protein
MKKELENYVIAVINTLWVLCFVYYFGNYLLQDFPFLTLMFFISLFTALIYWIIIFDNHNKKLQL